MSLEPLWVLDTLGVTQLLGFVLTRENVANPKSDHEVYLRAASQAEISPSEGLVVEGSLPGVQTGLAAEGYAVAVAAPFTEVGKRDAPELLGEPRSRAAHPDCTELQSEQGAQRYPFEDR